MSEDERLKFKASSEGVELEVSGGASRKLGASLADAISPFTEVLGAVGDELRRFRIHREEQTTKTLIRAKEIRAERNTEATPVSPKLLAPWLEGASLEDDSAENISELWATLLAECPEEFSADHAVFIDIFSRLGKSEADAIERFVPDHAQSGYMENPGDLDGVYLEIIESYIDRLINAFEKEDASYEEFTDPIFSWFNEKHERFLPTPARATFLHAVKDNNKDIMPGKSIMVPSDFLREHSDALVILEHNGLVTLRKIYFETDDGRIGGDLLLYELTRLGKKLLRILHPVYTKGVLVSRDNEGKEITIERKIRHR